MAIGQSSMFYDANRDMYYTAQERYERELYRRKEEEYRRQQALMQDPSYNPYAEQPKLANKAPKPDLNDPLAFLHNTDKKVLLTGEMQ